MARKNRSPIAAYKKEFSAGIRAYRSEKKLSMAQFAAELDVPLTTLKKYEYGVAAPSQDSIDKICGHIGMSVDEIIAKGRQARGAGQAGEQAQPVQPGQAAEAPQPAQADGSGISGQISLFGAQPVGPAQDGGVTAESTGKGRRTGRKAVRTGYRTGGSGDGQPDSGKGMPDPWKYDLEGQMSLEDMEKWTEGTDGTYSPDSSNSSDSSDRANGTDGLDDPDKAVVQDVGRGASQGKADEGSIKAVTPEAVKQARIEKDLSQAAVAELIGTTRIRYSRFENRKGNLSDQLLAKAGELLGITRTPKAGDALVGGGAPTGEESIQDQGMAAKGPEDPGAMDRPAHQEGASVALDAAPNATSDGVQYVQDQQDRHDQQEGDAAAGIGSEAGNGTAKATEDTGGTRSAGNTDSAGGPGRTDDANDTDDGGGADVTAGAGDPGVSDLYSRPDSAEGAISWVTMASRGIDRKWMPVAKERGWNKGQPDEGKDKAKKDTGIRYLDKIFPDVRDMIPDILKAEGYVKEDSLVRGSMVVEAGPDVEKTDIRTEKADAGMGQGRELPGQEGIPSQPKGAGIPERAGTDAASIADTTDTKGTTDTKTLHQDNRYVRPQHGDPVDRIAWYFAQLGNEMSYLASENIRLREELTKAAGMSNVSTVSAAPIPMDVVLVPQTKLEADTGLTGAGSTDQSPVPGTTTVMGGDAGTGSTRQEIQGTQDTEKSLSTGDTVSAGEEKRAEPAGGMQAEAGTDLEEADISPKKGRKNRKTEDTKDTTDTKDTDKPEKAGEVADKDDGQALGSEAEGDKGLATDQDGQASKEAEETKGTAETAETIEALEVLEAVGSTGDGVSVEAAEDNIPDKTDDTVAEGALADTGSGEGAGADIAVTDGPGIVTGTGSGAGTGTDGAAQAVSGAGMDGARNAVRILHIFGSGNNEVVIDTSVIEAKISGHLADPENPDTKLEVYYNIQEGNAYFLADGKAGGQAIAL